MIVCVDAIGIRDGGGASVLIALVESLSPARPDWHWIFYVDAALLPNGTLPKPEGNASIRYVRISGWFGRLLWLCHALPCCAKRAGADVVLSLANISPLRCRMPNVLFIQQSKVFDREGTGSLKTSLRYFLLGHLVRRSAASAYRIVVQTSHMRDLIARTGSTLSEKTKVIPSPVRTFPVADAEPKHPGDCASNIGFRLLYVSLAREHKNHKTLIKAFALLRRRFPDVCLSLTVSRPGDPNAGFLDRRLHDLAHDLDVAGAIRWLGWLGSREIAAAYAYADLTVFPSLNESYGLPLAESILAGTPVCAADLPYAREICGDAAAYFDPRDPQAMATTIGNVLESAEAIADLRVQTAARARCFEPSKLAESLCRELQNAARKKTVR